MAAIQLSKASSHPVVRLLLVSLLLLAAVSEATLSPCGDWPPDQKTLFDNHWLRYGRAKDTGLSLHPALHPVLVESSAQPFLIRQKMNEALGLSLCPQIRKTLKTHAIFLIALAQVLSAQDKYVWKLWLLNRTPHEKMLDDLHKKVAKAQKWRRNSDEETKRLQHAYDDVHSRQVASARAQAMKKQAKLLLQATRWDPRATSQIKVLFLLRGSLVNKIYFMRNLYLPMRDILDGPYAHWSNAAWSRETYPADFHAEPHITALRMQPGYGLVQFQWTREDRERFKKKDEFEKFASILWEDDHLAKDPDEVSEARERHHRELSRRYYPIP